MTDRGAELLVAGFLDSPQARGLAALRPAERRRGALLLCTAARDDLAMEPRLLEGEGARELMLEALPRRLGPKDPLIPAFPDLARAFFDYLRDVQTVNHAYEIEVTLADVDYDTFAAAVRAVPPEQRVAGKVDPIQSRGEKVGRNDPCPCGSGRKFKQCCWKLGS